MTIKQKLNVDYWVITTIWRGSGTVISEIGPSISIGSSSTDRTDIAVEL
jgi:hypothetical protein